MRFLLGANEGRTMESLADHRNICCSVSAGIVAAYCRAAKTRCQAFCVLIIRAIEAKQQMLRASSGAVTKVMRA
jgi:hypothetical protein